MQRKLESIFRATLVALAIILIWSVWAGAQPAASTNAPATDFAAKPAIRPLPLSPEQMHWVTFGLDRVEFLQHPFMTVPLWQYPASLIFLVLAFYFAKLIDWLVLRRLRKWAARTETKFDDILLELMRGPIRVITFVILLHIGLRVYVWPDWLETFLSKGLKLVVAASLTYVALKLIDAALDFWSEKSIKDQDQLFDAQLFPIIRKSLKAFVLIIAILVTAQNLDFQITSLLASLSIGGLALGLAAQDTVANVFGAISIFVDKPFRIGDRIQLDKVDGTVETIGLRSTRVRNLDGHLVTVPNKAMGNATITNVTARPNIKTEMNLGLTYDTPADKVQLALKLLNEIYRAHPMTEKVLITFNKFADSALNVQVVHWWKTTDFEAYLRGMQELNLEIKRRFDAEHIDFAFPSQTVYLKRE
ncbi:MAG TPA: mechanosensitive ion channel family protein [Verrucomicrobiae bacterium]|jgi:MscS family membrane protein